MNDPAIFVVFGSLGYEYSGTDKPAAQRVADEEPGRRVVKYVPSAIQHKLDFGDGMKIHVTSEQAWNKIQTDLDRLRRIESIATGASDA